MSGSLLDDAWLRLLKVAEAIFFLAAGVLYYLQESQVKAFLIRLASTFPGAEILFDACFPLGRKIANEKVIKAGGMDENAMLKWGAGAGQRSSVVGQPHRGRRGISHLPEHEVWTRHPREVGDVRGRRLENHVHDSLAAWQRLPPV